MKIYIKLLLVIFILNGNKLAAQLLTDPRKYIEVTGSAEKTITPDEIELKIVLTEYSKDGAVVRLDKIEKDFYALLRKNNVDTQQLKLNSLESNYWWYWTDNRNKPLKTKTFKLQINGDINFLKLAEDLDKKWVESVAITDKKNKKMQEYRKEVKIEAIKAAKEKAGYLLESIDEHVGNVLSVEELPEEGLSWFRNSIPLSNSASFSPGGSSDVENVSGIKIRYEVKVKFEIK